MYELFVYIICTWRHHFLNQFLWIDRTIDAFYCIVDVVIVAVGTTPETHSLSRMFETNSGATLWSGSILGGPVYLCLDFVHRLLRHDLLQILLSLPCDDRTPSVAGQALSLFFLACLEGCKLSADTLQFGSSPIPIRLMLVVWCGWPACVAELVAAESLTLGCGSSAIDTVS